MEGTRPNESWLKDDFTVDKRFHLIPAANLLVTIPFSNDRLVLRRLDLGNSIERFAGDRLVVTSSPVVHVQAGKAVQHQIEARSKAGGTRYSLESGPDGLTVSTTGKITWVPGQRFSGGDTVKIVVVIRDSSGQERSHRIAIRID